MCHPRLQPFQLVIPSYDMNYNMNTRLLTYSYIGLTKEKTCTNQERTAAM